VGPANLVLGPACLQTWSYALRACKPGPSPCVPENMVLGPACLQVGVLDEVQMISDSGRGWGWTRVLLGMQAQTLHVCGDPGALPVLQQLVHECGDELEVRACACVCNCICVFACASVFVLECGLAGGASMCMYARVVCTRVQE